MHNSGSNQVLPKGAVSSSINIQCIFKNLNQALVTISTDLLIIQYLKTNKSIPLLVS